MSNNFLLLLQTGEGSLTGMIIFFIIAAVLFIISIILFILRNKTANTLLEIKFIQTSQIKNIIENHKSITDQLGKGSYSEYVEIKGITRCANPLKSQHTNTDCVWYRSQILREYEETVTTRDEKGYTRTEIKRGNEVVSDIANKADFEIDDGTGRININSDSSEIVSKSIYNNFQPGEYRGTIQINFGPYSGRRTIGYRFKEEVIPVNQNLYIIGEASDRDGRLEIKKPLDKKKKFIVSVKSEEELVKSYKARAAGFLAGSIILTVIGVGLIIFGFFWKR